MQKGLTQQLSWGYVDVLCSGGCGGVARGASGVFYGVKCVGKRVKPAGFAIS